jgi:Histidine kinase/Y_Y_Y domain/Two component regulator propeller
VIEVISSINNSFLIIKADLVFLSPANTLVMFRHALQRYVILFFILLLGFSYSAKSQQMDLPSINFTTRNGLASDEVYCTLQDKRGYMWFGTDLGVSVYNGFGFTNYTSRDGLSDNTIFTMHEDQKGRIWFCTFNHTISYWENNRFYTLKDKTGHVVSLEKESGLITSIKTDSVNIYFVTMGTVFYFPLNDIHAEMKTLTCDTSTSITIHKYNNQFFVLANSFRIKRNEEKTYCYKENRAIISCGVLPKIGNGLNFTSVYMLSDDEKVCLFTFGNVLFRFEAPGKIEYKEYNGRIIYLKKADKGYAVCVEHKGYEFHSEGYRLDKKTNTLNEDQSVSSFCFDQEKGLWLTSLANGVTYYPSASVPCYYPIDPANNNIACIDTAYGSIFCGTATGDIIRLDKNNLENPSVQIYTNLHLMRIFDITKGEDSSLVVSSISGIIFFRILPDTIIPEKRYPWGLRHITKLNDSTYFGSMRYRSYFISREADSSIFVNGTSEIFTGLLRKNGDLLLGCINGILQKKDTGFVHLDFKNPGLNGRITVLHEDAAQNLWVGTRADGLYIIRPDKTIGQFTSDDGLISNSITDIQLNGNIAWVSTKVGLSKITFTPDYQIIRVMNFNYFDGILSNEIRSILYYDPFIFIGSSRGLQCYREEDLAENQIAPKIHLDIVRNLLSDSLKSSYDYKQNAFYFEFGISTFKSSGRVLIRYKLHAEDTAYIYLRNSNKLTLTDLQPGDYELSAYVANSSGIWSKNPVRYQFTIRHPFWQRAWFWLLIVFCLVSITTILFRYRIRSVKEVEQEKSKMLLRIEELKMETMRMHMNPHFVFNALNSIQHFIVKNNRNEAYHYLELFSSLIRNILEQTQHQFISVDDELKMLRSYVELESMRLQNTIQINWHIHPDIDESAIIVPPVLIQPFIENAIWHGLMPKAGDRQLDISFIYDPKYILCVVEDNGVGRDAAQKKHLQKKHISMGMSVSFQRIENLTAIGRKVTINIIDKRTNAEPAGTRVEIKIYKQDD